MGETNLRFGIYNYKFIWTKKRFGIYNYKFIGTKKRFDIHNYKIIGTKLNHLYYGTTKMCAPTNIRGPIWPELYMFYYM